MKILLFGKNGQVGWELQRSLAPLGELVALDRAGTPSGDLANPEAIRATVRDVKPDVIVNAAAYTAVDKAESEPDLCRTINALAPQAMAEEAARLGAWLVHYSTDYVFDGTGETPWREDDPIGPVNTYGATKAEGERGIAASGARHLVFRTSWVHAARGGNFIATMLRLGQERERLTVIDDQHGAPTGAELIADITAHAIQAVRRDASLAGTYHLAPAGETTWCGYARYLLGLAREAGAPVKAQVDGIPTTAYPTPARRPHNSRLDRRKLERAFGLQLPDWRLGVSRVVAEKLARP